MASALQLAFAGLFGLVAAQVAVLTRSLWPAVVWHALWDFTSFAGGNATTPRALVGLAVACALMLVAAVVLGHRTGGADRWS